MYLQKHIFYSHALQVFSQASGTALHYNKELLLILKTTRIINADKKSPPKSPITQLTEYTDIHELQALADVSLCVYWVLMPCGKIFHRWSKDIWILLAKTKQNKICYQARPPFLCSTLWDRFLIHILFLLSNQSSTTKRSWFNYTLMEF